MCPGVPQLTPPRRSAAYSPEQSAADYQQLLDKAKPGTSGAAPKKKPKKKKAKKDRRGEESKERPPEDAKDAEEGKPKAIRTKNCTPNCQCSTLSMTALRDRCSDEVHHGTLCFMSK